MSTPVEIVNTDWPGIATSGVIAGLVSTGAVLTTWKLSTKSENKRRDTTDLSVWREYLLRAEKIFEDDAMRRSSEEKDAEKSGHVPHSVWDSKAFNNVETEYWAMLHSAPPGRGTSADVIRQCLEAEFDFLSNRFGPRLAEKQAYELEESLQAEMKDALRKFRACPDGGDEEKQLKVLFDDAHAHWGFARLDSEDAFRWSAECRSRTLLRTIRVLKAKSFEWASAGRGLRVRSEIRRRQSDLRYKATHLCERGQDRQEGYWE
ncbi:hypothetical protein ACBG85_17015 [Rhodococcus sp. NyZ502]|uniref:hypothetical protein n=1 Tax=Rhodococcus sp. NyZ502 TaxID=3242855 RepID=UPI003555D632